MRRIYLLFFLAASVFVFAQNSQLYYSGTFLNHKNKPQNFLKVYNKNSGIYELTDEKGFAIIAAKPYDTLVWNNGKNKYAVLSYNLQELKNILDSRVEKQNVQNIYSKDYDNSITKYNDDTFSIENSKTVLSKNSDKYYYSVRKLKQKNDSLFKLKTIQQRDLFLNGNFTTSFEVKSRNSIPKTQNKYVQGRAENGNWVWRGPETNEMFSFGPDISTLGFDNQSYEFDENGSLVNLSNGILPAKIYNDDIFKTTVGFKNQLKVNAFIKEGYQEKIRLSLDLGQQKDQMYFEDQFNIVNTIDGRLNFNINGYLLNFGLNYNENKATNTNRIAFFNRVYQNYLLTPISFSNSQNIFLSNQLQRSYSSNADNPFYLFNQDKKYNYKNNHRQYNAEFSKKWRNFKLNLIQSYRTERYWNYDHYQPSTVGFNGGINNERIQNNSFYNSSILGNYSLGDYYFRNIFTFNFILNHTKSDVFNSLYQLSNQYQRTSQDYIFNYDMEINESDFMMGLNLGNSFYVSNTSNNNKYWLPKANAFVLFKDIFHWNNFNFKVLGSYTQLSSEPEITRSYASYFTTLLNAQNAFKYFPASEVQGFNGLSTIDTKEWKAGIALKLGYRINIEGEYFNRKINNDVFPVFENQQLQLKNLANHTYSGYDLSFNYENVRLFQNMFMNHRISFFSYKDIVNKVVSGYNNLPISGFNDIYKTLSGGNPLGIVMGSYFDRNKDGQMIIDENGFPKKADGFKIIANPTPDFILKFNHNFNYKRFSLDINWEWKKGGEIWNGTEVVLDYYGRSFQSGEDRNTKNYVFEGVNSEGNLNQIAVDFYNLSQDVSQNRWSRYGYLGVAENYVQKADYIKINNISLSAKFPINYTSRMLTLTFYVNNVLLWQENKGADPTQNFYDTDNGRGLDFFNLPSFKTFGCMVSFKF
ncbi:hypothetical protein [Chryseobacterium oryctis]|uniref:Uncharacterized protein n=1 Tax=Chryseobacterium oryctis TaxID=2952618 RepID=A0ABT3HRY2_9FLAO|nr:hypothetical protein [Chryseobacterium oryctis]MCW3162540.1 hypothetical protein [Chryseobacterium oryctis]